MIPTPSTPSISRGVDTIKSHLKTLPDQPGVYRMLGFTPEQRQDNTPIEHANKVLYVGKAISLKKRVASYTRPDQLPNRLQRMIAETVRMEFVTTHTETEALLLESNYIKQLEPKYNVLLRDDKHFPYILIATDHDFPQILSHRGSKKREGHYFGPFASASAVRRTITILQRAFLLRPCTDSFFKTRSRPCLQYQIKRCAAPCVNLIDKPDYDQLVKETKQFLDGKKSPLQAGLAKRMQQASDDMAFERAAILRDRIQAITEIQARQDINIPGLNEVDVVAIAADAGRACVQVFFFRNGQNFGHHSFFPQQTEDLSTPEILEAFLSRFYTKRPAPKHVLLSHAIPGQEQLAEMLSTHAERKVTLQVPQRGVRHRVVQHAERNAEGALARKLSSTATQTKLLKGVQEVFDLPQLPQRVEVYDNSHIQGQHAVGAMICAGPDGFMKQAYRRYNVDAIRVKGDDYAMMREVMQRRGQRILKEQQRPDLILLDGGQGQLSAALDVLTPLGLADLPLVAIAKGVDRNAGRERFFQPGKDEFSLPLNDPILYYLQRLRDEAHRFAITSHRGKRERAIKSSPLDEIPGIGPSRKKALMLHFGSAKAVSRAGIDDLARVEGISQTVAEKIYHHFYEE